MFLNDFLIMVNYGLEFECKWCGFYGFVENVESIEF